LLIRSDNNSTFGDEWAQLWNTWNVKVSHSAPYHPQGNGIIERSFRTLKEKLRAFTNENRDVPWVDALPFVQGAHNALSRESLGGLCPAEVMFGYRPKWGRIPSLPSLPSGIDWLVANDEALLKFSSYVLDSISA
jgi:transposase InsO family protein